MTDLEKLSSHIWPYSDTKTAVTNSFCDLGAHVNLTNSMHSPTSNQRSRESSRAVSKMARLLIGYDDKASHTRTRCLTKWLDGAEASQLTGALQRKLTAMIKNTNSSKVIHKDTR